MYLPGVPAAVATALVAVPLAEKRAGPATYSTSMGHFSTASTTEVTLPPAGLATGEPPKVARPKPPLRSCLKGKAKAEAPPPPPPHEQEPSPRAGEALWHYAGEEGHELLDDASSNATFSCTSFAPDGRFGHQSSQSSCYTPWRDSGESEDGLQ